MMPQPSGAPVPNQVPLVVDLDGTLIKTDLLWESIARLLRRNPFWLFPILFWWSRSRAFLKKKLAERVKIDPATLPYHEQFLAWLREQKAAGRKIILATASDREMALPVANYVGLFEETLGSDGKSNLRGKNKLKTLVEKFGDRGFDYAGNALPDLAIWRGSREAIVVNAGRLLVKQAAKCTKLGPLFVDDYSPFGTLKSFLNELLIRSGYLLAAVAGLLLAAAFPKINVAGLAWIAPGLLVFAAHGKKPGEALRVGFTAGIIFWMASLYWLLLIPAAGYPILGWFALSAFLALFFAVWTWLVGGKFIHESWSARTGWSLAGAAIWVALEMIRARIFGGFPWSFVGVSQFKMIPLIQIASITGVYGLSFLVVWTSLSFYRAARMIYSRPNLRFAWQGEIFLPLFAVFAIFVYGQIKLQNPVISTLRITLIQPSAPQTLIWDESANSNRFQQLLQLTENALTNSEGRVPRVPDLNTGTNSGTRIARPSDLLIWPESALPDFNDESYADIVRLLRAHRIWMICNANDLPETNSAEYNAAFLFDPDGVCVGIYHKQKLVIFGEYIPLARWLPFLKWFTPITGSFGAGDKPVTFAINGRGEDGGRLPGPREPVIELDNGPPGAPPRHTIKTSPLICFEDTFPQIAREAAGDDTDFLVNLTNDGWFGNGAEQWQHEANAIFRAVENGIPLVRCANNGVTCWIDATGRVREIFRDKDGSIYGMGAMTIDLPLQNHAPTFYHRHGDWFGWSCVGIFSILLCFKLVRACDRKSAR